MYISASEDSSYQGKSGQEICDSLLIGNDMRIILIDAIDDDFKEAVSSTCFFFKLWILYEYIGVRLTCAILELMPKFISCVNFQIAILTEQPIVGVAVEGVNIGRDGQLGFVQVRKLLPVFTK